ncbi:hypothetical protein V6N12_025435 [Hibiscus sabdariffa]|uniref:hAT-like transposase RNase-H fold domain-containing protein n=1 Tax=Hibiscus sabdariffa TaxID=183260 RepID=A0ABR2CIE6_9ROSI
MVQHGLQQVQDIIEKVHDTVDFLNASDARLKRFGELASQYNVQDRKLILECKTRWNSTYDMLDCAIKFRKVFPRYALHDHSYNYCPDDDEWEKIEKLLEILKVFKATTNIISGSEYPTANLFLGEVQRIKVLLDVKSESLDDFVKSMVVNMKERFTKYWGECNLLMAIGLVMDPRLKMRAVDIAFPKMFPSDLVRENIGKVKDIMYQLFEEYLRIYSSTCNVEESGECAFPINAHGGDVTSSEKLASKSGAVSREPELNNFGSLHIVHGSEKLTQNLPRVHTRSTSPLDQSTHVSIAFGTPVHHSHVASQEGSAHNDFQNGAVIGVGDLSSCSRAPVLQSRESSLSPMLLNSSDTVLRQVTDGDESEVRADGVVDQQIDVPVVAETIGSWSRSSHNKHPMMTRITNKWALRQINVNNAF